MAQREWTTLSATQGPTLWTRVRTWVQQRAKRTEARCEAEARWRVLLDEAPVVELICNLNGRITAAAGGALARMRIRTPPRSESRPITTIIPDPQFKEAFHAALQGAASYLDIAMEGRHFVVRLEPLRGPDGVLGAFIFARDQTDTVTAEHEAAQARDEYKALFDESREPLYVCDLNGRLQLVNAAMLRLFGHETRDSLMATDLAKNFFGLRTGRRGALDDILARGGVQNRPLRIKCRDGSVRQVLESCTLLRSAEDKPTAIRGMLQDVTEARTEMRRRNEEERARAAATLGAAAAHDFNNHLTVIAANLELLREDFDQADREMHAMRIMKAVRGAKVVCERLTQLGRPLECRLQPLTVGEFLLEQASALEDLLGPAWELELRVGLELPRIEADASLLAQALMNLCTNARDAMREGGTVEVHLDCPDPLRRDFVEFSVMDRGVGIPAELRRSLFQPFATSKGPGRGSGLGLWIVRRVAELHGGTIDVHDRQGGGTVFRLRLPAQVTPALRDASDSGIIRVASM